MPCTLQRLQVADTEIYYKDFKQSIAAIFRFMHNELLLVQYKAM